MPSTSLPPVQIPEEVIAQMAKGHGEYFTKFNRMPPDVLARDMLNPDKAIRAHEILVRYVNPGGKKILEIGSGYGITLISWVKQFGLDVTGAEPEGEGFAHTVELSRELCKLNGVPPERVVVGEGEALPFPDESFDIVYSSNTVEHCNDPAKVMAEAIRVLKPGGILLSETPNFLSYFEGHYYVFMPPLFFKWMFPWWVKNVMRRDPSLARQLRTEINPVWAKKTIAAISKKYPARIVTTGEDVFRDRLKQPFEFQHKAVQKLIGPIISTLQRLNIGNLMANIIVMLRGHYPMYLVVEKLGKNPA